MTTVTVTEQAFQVTTTGTATQVTTTDQPVQVTTTENTVNVTTSPNPVVTVTTIDQDVHVTTQPVQVQVGIADSGSPPLTIEDTSGAVAVSNLVRLRVPTGSLVNDGGGQATITLAGAVDAYYRHVQIAASSVWTIDHNLGKFPSVSVVDSAGDEVYGNVHYVNSNQITIAFAAMLSGEAYMS